MDWCQTGLLFICFIKCDVFVIGLRLEEFWVPEAGVFGESVTLRCEFNLESDELLSVKWYKDEHEFFSYSPQRSPNIQRFHVSGVFVQNNSTVTAISLSNLTLEASGNYKCEVSAERPSYRTLTRDGNLSIVVLPDPQNPLIRNIPFSARVGDTVRGNCTSFRSRPPASLTFYINNQKVLGHELIDYDPVVGTWKKGNSQLELYTSVLGFNFIVSKQHFHQGLIKIRCSSKLAHTTKLFVTDLVIQHENYRGHSSTATGSGYAQTPNSSGRCDEIVLQNPRFLLFLLCTVLGIVGHI